MKQVILVTSSFPYLSGEQFLETEVKYYSQYKDVNFTIMPRNKYKEQRKLASNIKVDNYLVDIKQSTFLKIYFLFKSMFTRLFYKELSSHRLFTFKKIKIFLSSMALYQLNYDYMDKYFSDKKNLKDTIIYTYWHDEAAYALQRLKKKYHYKIVSRIHGQDIYQERKICHYMPLKKYFTQNIDKIYTITDSAIKYLHDTYGFNLEIIKLSRLGVNDWGIVSLPNGKDILHIASCSYLTEVKRVDKIITALELLSTKYKNIDFIWSHIGDGYLYDNLVELAHTKLSHLDNIHFDFLGNLDNKEVYKFYKRNKVDVFINVSESEGVPVSIMEAMSCHIPIVAPNVGGISDMIEDGESGFLLSDVCEIDEICNALINSDFFKRKNVRENSYKIFLDKYNAEKNYKAFLEDLML